MTLEQMEAIIFQARDAWLDGNAQGFADLFLPDGIFIVPGQKWQGRDAIRQSVTEFISTHTAVKIDIHQIIVDGTRAVVEWSWEETEKASGQRSQAEDAIVVDFAGGSIQRWREYIDLETPKTT